MSKLRVINFIKKPINLALLILILSSILLFCCNQINILLYSPETIPEEWLEIQPYLEITIFSLNFIIVQPSSTFFVYLLGVLSIIIGAILFGNRHSPKFEKWWRIALIFWGIGAILAGTSYQAFSYEIKCVDKPFCIWTSLWEIFYLVFSVGSVNAMLLAQSNLNGENKWNKIMEKYAFFSKMGE